MSENTKIEWCDHTFNPWTGCTKVSPGCANCYAEGWSKRSGIVEWGPGKPRRRTSVANWRKPIRWDREAGRLPDFDATKEREWHRPKVFCASLADWLDDEIPIEWLVDLLLLIRGTPSLDWLLLTKRPENWGRRISDARNSRKGFEETDLWMWLDSWLDCDAPDNVWIGTTVEDQRRADERIPALLRIPAKVRFLSCEPLLEQVDLVNLDGFNILCDIGIDWVIAGGESGPGHRAFNPDWARDLRDQCELSVTTAFFMKQMGGSRKPFAEIPSDLMIREFPKGGEA